MQHPDRGNIHPDRVWLGGIQERDTTGGAGLTEEEEKKEAEVGQVKLHPDRVWVGGDDLDSIPAGGGRKESTEEAKCTGGQVKLHPDRVWLGAEGSGRKKPKKKRKFNKKTGWENVLDEEGEEVRCEVSVAAGEGGAEVEMQVNGDGDADRDVDMEDAGAVEKKEEERATKTAMEVVNHVEMIKAMEMEYGAMEEEVKEDSPLQMPETLPELVKQQETPKPKVKTPAPRKEPPKPAPVEIPFFAQMVDEEEALAMKKVEEMEMEAERAAEGWLS